MIHLCSTFPESAKSEDYSSFIFLNHLQNNIKSKIKRFYDIFYALKILCRQIKKNIFLALKASGKCCNSMIVVLKEEI